MLSLFCNAGTVWQVFLLVLSLLTVISLTIACVISFRHKHNARPFGLGAGLLVLNAALYVLMQIDSRITGAQHILHLPYLLALLVTLLSLSHAVWSVLRETKNRKIINNTSIKEAFDNLPTGVCFFNEAGLPVLCNRAMHRFSFSVCGKDLQFISDLQDCLSDDFIPVEGAEKAGKFFTLSDGSIWQLEKHRITHESGEDYTQFITLDVTQLQHNRAELMEENAQLRQVQAQLKQLSANVVAVTREEEILNTKMRVHDEMGRCLVAAQKYLRDDNHETIPDSIAASWQRAVSKIKYSNETPEEDMLLQIRKTCEYMHIAFFQTGELPKQERVAYLLTCAVRECVTNAVRYADATELYVAFHETDEDAAVAVTNNGNIPEHEIVEGGGLSTLRRRVERAGGTMTVQSFPCFQLTVTVPKEKEGLL